MIEIPGFAQGIDHARSMGDHFAANAKTAAEQMLESGQEVQAQIASQVAGHRDRLLVCLDHLAKAGDPASASRVGASYIGESMHAYGENMAQWSELLLRSVRRGFSNAEKSLQSAVPAE